VTTPWQTLGIPFAITPLGQLHQSPPSPIPRDLGRGPSHQANVLEHRDTYGQAQVCSQGHQGSRVDRPFFPFFFSFLFFFFPLLANPQLNHVLLVGPQRLSQTVAHLLMVVLSLRIEFLLKTDSGFPKNTGVTLFSLAIHGNSGPLHFNTPRSALPVSALAHSRGPRKRSQSPVSRTRT